MYRYRTRSSPKPEKVFLDLFRLENRGVNPRFSPRPAAVSPFTALRHNMGLGGRLPKLARGLPLP